MERPPTRPEGALIRLARKAAHVTVPDAARSAGISKARWTQVESGRESRNGTERVVNAKADTIAHMARAVGLPPERLESEGERPDAAEVLREILRAQPPSPGPASALAQEIAYDSASADAAARVFPGDRAAQAFLLDGRIEELAEWLEYRRERAATGYPQDRQDGPRDGTAGLRDR